MHGDECNISYNIMLSTIYQRAINDYDFLKIYIMTIIKFSRNKFLYNIYVKDITYSHLLNPFVEFN